MDKELAVIYVDTHQVMIVQEINEYEVFVSDNGGITLQPIITVKGLQNALASVSAMIENDPRLSPDASFLVRQKGT